MQQRAEKSAEKGTYLCISSPPNLKPTNSQSQMFSHPSCHDHKIVRKTQLTCPQAFVPTVCPRCLPQLHRWPEYLLPVSPFNASIERRNSRPRSWGRPRNPRCLPTSPATICNGQIIYSSWFSFQCLLLLLLPHPGSNIRCHDWWETLRQQFDDGLLLLLLLGPGKKTTATHQHLRLGWIHHPPPSTLPHKSTQSATLPASNLVVGLLSGKKGKKSD